MTTGIKKEIQKYADRVVGDHIDRKTGEVETTALYESIVNHFQIAEGSDLDEYASDVAAIAADAWEEANS